LGVQRGRPSFVGSGKTLKHYSDKVFLAGMRAAFLVAGKRVTSDPGLSSRAEIGILEGCRPVAEYSIGDVDIAALGVRLAAAVP
jgi:hypothetical protein